MSSQQCWEGKLESALFSRVQSGKITVYVFVIIDENRAHVRLLDYSSGLL